MPLSIYLFIYLSIWCVHRSLYGLRWVFEAFILWVSRVCEGPDVGVRDLFRVLLKVPLRAVYGYMAKWVVLCLGQGRICLRFLACFELPGRGFIGIKLRFKDSAV